MRALEPAGTCHRLETFAPAYILDLSPNGLGAMRVLARQGVPVLGFDCDPSREGFRSCLGRKEVCPDPVREPAALLGYLRERARGEPARPFLLPGNDKFVRFLAEHQAELSREFAFVAPPGNLLLACLSKDKTYALAEQAGVPVPRCAAVAPGGGPELVPDDFPYPAVIKPSFSYDLWGLTRGKVLIARCPEEAVQVLGRLPPEAGFVIQEAIPGEETRLVFYSTYRDGAGRVRAASSSPGRSGSSRRHSGQPASSRAAGTRSSSPRAGGSSTPSATGVWPRPSSNETRATAASSLSRSTPASGCSIPCQCRPGSTS